MVLIDDQLDGFFRQVVSALSGSAGSIGSTQIWGSSSQTQGPKVPSPRPVFIETHARVARTSRRSTRR